MFFSQSRFQAAYQIVQQCQQCPLAIVPHLLSVATVSSTNQSVWEYLDQGEPEGIAVIAAAQTAGRGQWGRQWASAAGGLYLSVGLRPNLAIDQAAQLTLSTAWGIATALRQIPGRLSGVADSSPVQIKWPNDLVLKRRKLGGILTETRMQQGRIHQAVVGVGVNWTNPVPDMGIQLQEFLSAQTTPLIESLEMLTAIVLFGILTGYQTWQQQGIAVILPGYWELLTHRDRTIEIEGQPAQLIGLTPEAELIVQFLPQSLTGKELQSSERKERVLQPGTISLGYPV
jgi:BirA family biotin operon repressor/biotin-[acetyl-CoA-carboxylase] ligase